MLNTNQLNNLWAAAIEAHSCELDTGIPCELIVAQWAQESGWGTHAPGNNCFGIKAYPGCYGRQLLHTKEWFTDEQMHKWLAADTGRTAMPEDGMVQGNRKRYQVQDWFATFATLAECFKRRARLLLLGIYAASSFKYTQDKNFVAYVQAISPHYATDPAYAADILKIASMPEVAGAIKQARDTAHT